jgi:hypothetical protein
VAVVEHPDVAEPVFGARLELLAVALDAVPVQIEGNVVGADHDAVVRAVEEIAVERRVGGDCVAAAHVAGAGLAARYSRGHRDRCRQGYRAR